MNSGSGLYSFGFRFLGSIQGRILSIVIVAAIGFGVYIALNFAEARRQASLLEKIQNQHFPIHVQLQQAVFALKQTNAYLEEAVFTAELSGIERAQNVSKQFLEALGTAVLIEPGSAEEMGEMASEFNSYYTNSVYLANKLIEGAESAEHLAKLGKNNADTFERLVEKLEKRLEKETLSFTEGIDLVSERARKNVTTGAFTGLMTTLLIVCVAWLLLQRVVGRIKYMVSSLKNIAENKSDLSTRIPIENDDEMSVLAHWFNTFLEKLERVTNESSRKMEHLANTDTLTGLPNRRLFNRILNKTIEETGQNEDLDPVVFFIDLDDFKCINDRLGHDVGDAVLRIISERLVSVTRYKTDMRFGEGLSKEAPESIVARMGGDEFMLLTTGVKSKTDLTNIAERLRKVVLEPLAVNGHDLQVGVSIGIAQFPVDGEDANQLVIHADMAMYEAKRGGKNNYRFFDRSIAQAVNQTVTMENMFRNALKHDEFELYAQPIFDFKTQKIVSAELLLRWHSQEAANVSPMAFISTAEKSDLIFELDEWVMNKACAIIQQLQREGFNTIPMSINVSAKQASHTNLVDKVVGCLNRYDVSPHLLLLEITETTALANIETVAENIEKLKSLSISVAIDDFGAGHSSLMLLKHCDIDILKIDKAFIDVISTNKSVSMIVESVISLAKNLKLNIVAEGIESADQASLLKNMDCQRAQGYYFEKPMPISEFKELLKRESNEYYVKSINI